jgi:L-ascorbate metabolism protein UlaG (beta-lactamase superfamily)
MRVELLGHACVTLTTESGQQLLIDPYEPGGFDGQMRYPPIEASPDFVATTHDHADHAATDAVPGEPEVLDEARDVEAGPFRVRRFEFDHDEYDGRRFGGSVDVLLVEADGQRIVHGADIGQSPPPSVDPVLRRSDLFLVPVGGLYTIGAGQAVEWCARLAPRRVMPIHFKTEQCDLPIDGPETFLHLIASHPMNAFEGAVHTTVTLR